ARSGKVLRRKTHDDDAAPWTQAAIQVFGQRAERLQGFARKPIGAQVGRPLVRRQAGEHAGWVNGTDKDGSRVGISATQELHDQCRAIVLVCESNPVRLAVAKLCELYGQVVNRKMTALARPS